jgi:hypothetical protein
LEASADWQTVTVRFGFDWFDAPPKFCSVGIFGPWIRDYQNTTDNGNFYIKFANISFKKNTYRSGAAYPEGEIAQLGDEFFRITSEDTGFGYPMVYGKHELRFAAPMPSGYSPTGVNVFWPAQIAAQWTQGHSDLTCMKTQPTLSYSTARGIVTWTKGDEMMWLRSEGYVAREATYKRPLLGPAKITMNYFPTFLTDVNGDGQIIDVFPWIYQNAVTKATALGTISDTHCFTKLQVRYSGETDWNTIATATKSTYGSTGSIASISGEVTGSVFFDMRLQVDGTRVGSSSDAVYDDRIFSLGVHSVDVEGFGIVDNEGNTVNIQHLSTTLNSSLITFTGQHKCVVEGEAPGTGMIVSSTGKYDNMNYETSDKRFKVNPQEAVPTVITCNTEKDKKVLGVVCDLWREGRLNNTFQLTDGTKSEEDYIPRYEINSLGEGGIWVSNIAGDLENGDYICSSNIPGYGMKQDDDILRNYTVAKITQDCMCDLESTDYDCKEVEDDGIVYKVAFVGCTYHCG